MRTLNERMASVETDLKGHKEQCVSDKSEIKQRFDSIDNKLWAVIAGIVVHLVVIIGYLVTEGTPWEPKIEIADRWQHEELLKK